MNILLTNWTLKGFGGSERWTYDLSAALQRYGGHSVHYFTLEKGIISDELELLHCWEHKESNQYDLIIANHYSCIERLKHRKEPIYQVIHGLTPTEERPHPRANRYFVVSEEIKQGLNLGEVVRNSVDLEWYRARPYPANFRALCLCQGEPAQKKVLEACQEQGIEVNIHTKHHDPVWHMRRLITRHQLVFGAGRGIVEAMACGRQVLVCDERHYYPGGLLNLDMEDARNHNYSGRGTKSQPLTVSALLSAIDHTLKNPQNTRAIAEKYHNIKEVVRVLTT